MTLEETLAALKKAGTAQNRKVYGKHGVPGEMYGVSYAELGKLNKKIGVDHELALSLWDSGIHDARVLATMVADPAQLKSRQLDAWVRELDNYVLTGAVAGLVARSPLALKKFEGWKNRKSEWVAAAGWDLVSSLAMQPDHGLSDAFCLEQIKLIQKEIHDRPNRTRHSMNQALIALGVQNDKTHGAAVKAANKIGKVVVDHGDTSCKTPEPVAYMAKTLAHRNRKKGKK